MPSTGAADGAVSEITVHRGRPVTAAVSCHSPESCQAISTLQVPCRKLAPETPPSPCLTAPGGRVMSCQTASYCAHLRPRKLGLRDPRTSDPPVGPVPSPRATLCALDPRFSARISVANRPRCGRSPDRAARVTEGLLSWENPPRFDGVGRPAPSAFVSLPGQVLAYDCVVGPLRPE